MLSSLIETKLYIPPMRPDHVVRPRLVDFMDNGYLSGRRLTLISAPAGYGKTSLLIEWQSRLSSRQVPLAWLALEEGDNDPHRFLHYLLAAMRRVYPKIGQELVGLLDLPQPPSPLEIAGGVVNEIAVLGAPLVLVLDDCHLVSSPAVNEVIAFLIDHGPVNLHIVIASRYDPLLPLPRLRARGQLTEVRLKDLRFQTEETAAFLHNGMGWDLPEASLKALQERTEGWAAGVQLAAISLADKETSSDQFIQSFSGDDRHILDYLLEEVLARQPDEIQQFLLDTSVLDKFCSCLCDELTGDPEDGKTKICQDIPSLHNSSQKILDYLDRANLFLIPLDNRRVWFRYHHLFSDALRHRLHSQDPGRAAILHKKAARWFDQNRLPAPAFDHAMASGDLNLAADIAERWMGPVVSDGQVHQVRTWLQALPKNLVDQRPEILFRKFRMHRMIGETERSIEALDRMQYCLETLPDPLPRRSHLWTLLYTARAELDESHGNLADALDDLEKAARWLPEDDIGLRGLIASYRGYVFRSQGDLKQAEAQHGEMFRTSLQSKSFLGMFDGVAASMWAMVEQGQARRALQKGEDFLKEYYEEIKNLPSSALVYERMAHIAYFLNRLMDAETWMEKAFDHKKQGGMVDGHGIFRHYLAQIKWALDKESEVEPLMREAQQWMRRSVNPRNQLLSGAVRARVRLHQGDLPDAAGWADTYLPHVDKPYRHDFEDNTLAWIWLAQGKALEALHFLEDRQANLEAKGIHLYLIENLGLQALALQRLGNQSEALEKIQRALQLAEPEGLDRIFLDLGFEMALLLSRLIASSNSSDRFQTYYGKLLSGFPEKDRDNLQAVVQQPKPSVSVKAEEWVEGLSEREIEVLRWMARGLNNMQIADQMVVAESTVKKHINHIFGKLGVENRTQALIKARERGLL